MYKKSLFRVAEGIGPVKPGNLYQQGAKSYRISILKDEEFSKLYASFQKRGVFISIRIKD